MLLFPISSKGFLYASSHRHDSTYCGFCCTSRGALAGTRNSSMGPLHEGSIRYPSHHKRTLLPRSYIALHAFSFQPVLHDWCNKGRGMCYPVCGMMHIKEPLLLIVKSSHYGGSGFSLSLSEWSFTICATPYNRK